MPKYLISWDAGWGVSEDTVECDDEAQAQEWAYSNAQDEFESNVEYSAVLALEED